MTARNEAGKLLSQHDGEIRCQKRNSEAQGGKFTETYYRERFTRGTFSNIQGVTAVKNVLQRMNHQIRTLQSL